MLFIGLFFFLLSFHKCFLIWSPSSHRLEEVGGAVLFFWVWESACKDQIWWMVMWPASGRAGCGTQVFLVLERMSSTLSHSKYTKQKKRAFSCPSISAPIFYVISAFSKITWLQIWSRRRTTVADKLRRHQASPRDRETSCQELKTGKGGRAIWSTIILFPISLSPNPFCTMYWRKPEIYKAVWMT